MMVTDPELAELQARFERERVRMEDYRQRRRTLLIQLAQAQAGFDEWTLAQEESEEEPPTAAARQLKRKELGAETLEEDLAQLERLMAGQPARVAAAKAKVDAASWAGFLARAKPRQTAGRALLQQALEIAPRRWPREILPELQILAALEARERLDIGYLLTATDPDAGPRRLPDNALPLAGFTNDVEGLMRFFGAIGPRVMNGLGSRAAKSS